MEENKELSGGTRRADTILETLKPYIYSLFIASNFGGFNIVSKVYLDKGMSRYNLVAYGLAFATITTVVLALLFERVFARILYYLGLEYTSLAFASTMNNLSPSMTFILAILCRMEKLDITKHSGQAKIGGTIVSFGGATIMTIYKGITVLSLHNNHHPHQNATSKVFFDRNLVKGSIILLDQILSISIYYVLQITTVRRYPAPLTLTTLISLLGTLMATIAAAILDHKASSWKLHWDITLLAPLYNGIIIFGISTYVQALVVRKRGPVFMTVFRPLSTIIVAIMGLVILGDTLHLGEILGAVAIIIGLHAILWGKKEEKRRKMLEHVICDRDIETKVEK